MKRSGTLGTVTQKTMSANGTTSNFVTCLATSHFEGTSKHTIKEHASTRFCTRSIYIPNRKCSKAPLLFSDPNGSALRQPSVQRSFMQ
jgi:hypothetical protein